ncbi:MAG: DUF1289 domain-containing protein [Candidatus Puniceispirillales bacterium]
MTNVDMTYHAMLEDALDYDTSSHSPCVGICDHTEHSGCSGCQRPHDEVTVWRDAGPDLRRQRWHELPTSLADNGISTMRLPLSQDAILQLADARLDHGGAWMVGGRTCQIRADRRLEKLTATNADQTTIIRLASDIRMRAVLWAPQGRRLDDEMQRLPIILVTPRIRIERQEGWHQRQQSTRYPDMTYQSDIFRICSNDQGGMMMESVIAEAEQQSPAQLPDQFPTVMDMPDGLILPDSYVLGLTLLPPDLSIS